MNVITPKIGQLSTENLSPAQQKALEALIAKKKAQARDSQTDTKIPVITGDLENQFKPFPLTDIQQAQWFGRSGLFDITVAGHGYVEFDCKGKDLDRLEQAFRLVIEGNPQMRMLVLPNLEQQVLEHVPAYNFRRYDMRGSDQAHIEQTLAEVRERMSHEILPADRWPIFEVCASLWGEDELRIHFSFDLLVGDAWSFRMVMDEWANLYDDPTNHRRRPTQITYRDYALGLDEIEKSDLFAKDLAYWQKELAELAPGPQLPMIRQPSELTSIRAKHFKIKLSADEWSALKAAIKRNNLTPSAFFAAAFSEVISLWNPNPRHTLNVTIFNRLPVHPQINDILVGEFNSFLLLDVNNGNQGTFTQRAGKLQALMWNHLEHRWVTGVRLMRELAKIQGASAGESLMPVVFTSTLAHHEGESDIPTRSPGEWIYEVSQTPQVWMEHHLWEEGDALSLHLDVVEGLFPDGLIEDFAATYERLIRALSADETAWNMPNAASLLPASHTQMWAEYNATSQQVPEGLLHEPFMRAAAQHREKIAVHCASGAKTYSQLDQISNQLANWLHDNGVATDELVAVIAPKGWEQIAGVLGVAKSGAAYLPIDFDQPQARINDILADAGVRFVVSTAQTIASFNWPDSVETICVNSQTLNEYNAKPVKNPATPDNIAYVIYTSGSTGKPKGCVITHRAALNTVVDINQRFNVTDQDVIFAISALSFDLSVYDIFGGLGTGATLVMPANQLPDPSAWHELCVKHGLTVWNSVPALIEVYATFAEETGKIIPPSLRLALLSGDWIPINLSSTLSLINFDMDIISLGGATEASIWSIYHPIKEIAPDWKSIPYGRPLANQTIHVLNHWLEDCPAWATGEIYIGGVGVAKEYYNSPTRTAASFITHPQTGERLYKTGDLGRMRPEGFVEFLGRKDAQVKLRGYRIELGEIEDALVRTGLTSHGVVLMTGDSNANRQLIAFVVPAAQTDDEPAFIETLNTALGTLLPKYMVPQQIVVLDSLPLTANGKVDRKKLGSLGADMSTKIEYVAPRNDTEERIATLWQNLLGVEKVGVFDDFFGLGGNSLIASRLIVKIHEIFEIELPFAKLFSAANVAALSEIVVAEVLADIEAMEAA